MAACDLWPRRSIPSPGPRYQALKPETFPVSFNWKSGNKSKKLSSILLLLLAVFALVGCNRYPAVTSREGRLLIKRLYVACNSKSEAKLSGVAEDLSKFSEAGTISVGEKQAFDS